MTTGIVGLTAEEFYAQRDNRTGLVVASTAYREQAVQITLSPPATSFADQVTFLTTVNLTSRWCRAIALSGPAVALDKRLAEAFGWEDILVVEAATSLARAADPFASVSTGVAGEASVHLEIGTTSLPGAYPILGRGWRAMAGGALREGGDTENPLGATLAACVGASYLFRAAIGAARPGDVHLSLWNLGTGAAAEEGPPLRRYSLGRVLVVGCGAVGSAILYLLPLAGLSGEFHLIDADKVKISNLSTAPIFFADRVGDEKVQIVSEYLKRSGLAAIEHPLWFDEAVRQERAFAERPDLVIPAANERDVRHHIQNQLPPLQIYGTTGNNWQAFLGRHIPLKEDCLACRFPGRRSAGEPALACGSSSVQATSEAETPVTATLPFLPMTAAVMAVAELNKTGSSGYPGHANFACLDLLGKLDGFLLVLERPRRGCSCTRQASAWKALNATTKFAQLSL